MPKWTQEFAKLSSGGYLVEVYRDGVAQRAGERRALTLNENRIWKETVSSWMEARESWPQYEGQPVPALSADCLAALGIEQKALSFDDFPAPVSGRAIAAIASPTLPNTCSARTAADRNATAKPAPIDNCTHCGRRVRASNGVRVCGLEVEVIPELMSAYMLTAYDEIYPELPKGDRIVLCWVCFLRKVRG